MTFLHYIDRHDHTAVQLFIQLIAPSAGSRQVKVNGMRVNLREVESTMSRFPAPPVLEHTFVVAVSVPVRDGSRPPDALVAFAAVGERWEEGVPGRVLAWLR